MAYHKAFDDPYVLWPDGTYCPYDDFDYEADWAWMSDDFTITEPVGYTPDGDPIFEEKACWSTYSYSS